MIVPSFAGAALSGDDSKFLTAMSDEGIPLLYTIPAAMKAGIYHGDSSAITDIAKEQTDALNAFIEKINGYTLSSEVKQVRDKFLSSTEMYKSDLTHYSTLVPSCGSCITAINEMYPRLTGEAKKTVNELIVFYQVSASPVN